MGWTRRRGSSYLVVVALLTLGLLSTGLSAASAQETPATECFTDARGDTLREDGTPEDFPRADIVEHCVAYGATLSVRLRVAQPTDPMTDGTWQHGTLAMWPLDTTGDDVGEFVVEYSLEANGDLGARVHDVRTEDAAVACNAEATFDGTWYRVNGITRECIDDAEAVRPQAGFFYVQRAQDRVHYDIAPGADAFADAVARVDEVCPDPQPAPFADRDQIAPVHRANVDCLFQVGVALGQIREDGERFFVPLANITRGQFAGFLFRSMRLLGVDLPPPQRPRFVDVPEGHTFDEAIHRLAAAGVIRGYDGQHFGPADHIRRDQTGSLLVRSHDFATGEDLVATEPGTHFRDTAGNVHASNIDAAFEAGLVFGVEAPEPGRPGRYEPATLTTRQQMASVLVRYLDALL